MTIRRILQVSVPVVAAVSLLGACAADTTKVATKAPATIRVGARAGGNAEKVAAAGVAADSAMRIRPTTYVAGEGLVEPTGPRTAWYFPAAGSAATDAQKAALAKVFGLSGTWTTLPKDQGGYQFLGDASKGEASLSISNDALQSWWYSPSWNASAATSTVSVGCAEPGIAVGEPAPADGSASSEPNAAGTTDTTVVAPDVRPCEVVDAPKPPANVPSKSEAEAKAKELLTSLGLDPAAYTFDTYADEWGAYVTGWLNLDGIKTQLAVGFGFGAEGALTSANGFLASPQRGDQYDLVGIAKAVERMNDPSGYWFGYFGGGPVGIAARGAAVDAVSVDAVAAAPAAEGTSGSAAGGGTDPSSTDPGLAPEPVPSDVTVTTPSIQVDPVPAVSEPPLETFTVTLTGVSVGLSQLWDADGNVWLLPSYVFTDATGGQYSVYGIADEYLDFAAINAPAPTDTATVETAVVADTVAPEVTAAPAPAGTEATKEN